MFAARSRFRRRGLLGLILALGAGLAGCASDRVERPSPDVTNVVQRPVYPVPDTKPLYLGGYAGAYYGPGGRDGR